MTTNNDPVKEAITEARRTQILDAAVHVFAEKGFHKATIRDVAQAAGVADGTIYNYFKNKQDLLVAMIARLGDLAHFAEQLAQFAAEATPEQILTFTFSDRTALLERNRAKIQALVPQVISDAELRSHFFHTLVEPTMAIVASGWQTQLEQDHIRQVDPNLLVRMIFGSFLGLALLDLIGDETFSTDPSAMSRALIDLLLHGLLPRSDENTTDQGEC